MKFRRDFVTNSSSTSFIAARMEEPTEEQKKVLLDFIDRVYFSNPILKPGATDEEIRKTMDKEWIDEEHFDEIKKALSQGLTIYYNILDVETTEMIPIWQERLVDSLKETDLFVSIIEQYDY